MPAAHEVKMRHEHVALIRLIFLILTLEFARQRQVYSSTVGALARDEFSHGGPDSLHLLQALLHVALRQRPERIGSIALLLFCNCRSHLLSGS